MIFNNQILVPACKSRKFANRTGQTVRMNDGEIITRSFYLSYEKLDKDDRCG